MSTNELEDDGPDSADARGDPDGEREFDDRLEVVAQLEMLAEENRRLRKAYADSRRSQYRHTAYGLVALGLIAILGGLLFPNGRQVLFALAGTGLFGGLLTYYLTPDQFVAADVGERIYASMAANTEAFVDELGLREDRIYVPTGDSTIARLFVPQRADYEIPEDVSTPIVTDGRRRGLLLATTGTGLFREFERTLDAELASTPGVLGEQIADGLVEVLELARVANVDVDGNEGRATVAIAGSTLGPVDRFDHPIASFVATGFAAAIDRPVTLEVVAGDDRADWLVTCRWNVDDGAAD